MTPQTPVGFVPDGFEPDAPAIPTSMAGGDTIRGEDPDAPSLMRRLQEALGHAAQPESVGDFLSLIIPSGAGEAITGLKDMHRIFRQAVNESPSLRGILPKLVDVLRERPKTVQDFQAQGFNRLPLAQQMEHLPAVPAAPRAVGATPPVIRAPQGFNDLPLSQQMEHLPQTPAPSIGRAAPPPIARGGQSFNDLPLYRQMEVAPPPVSRVPTSSAPLRATPVAPAASRPPATAQSTAARALNAEERQAVDALVQQGHAEADVLAELEKLRPAEKLRPSSSKFTPEAIKLRMNASETKEYLRLLKRGKSPADATELLKAQREMVQRLGVPDSETVREAVRQRNETGRWKD